MKRKKKSIKRRLAFLLAMLLCVSMSLQAAAQEGVENHTEPAVQEQTQEENQQEESGSQEESGPQETDVPGEGEADASEGENPAETEGADNQEDGSNPDNAQDPAQTATPDESTPAEGNTPAEDGGSPGDNSAAEDGQDPAQPEGNAPEQDAPAQEEGSQEGSESLDTPAGSEIPEDVPGEADGLTPDTQEPEEAEEPEETSTIRFVVEGPAAAELLIGGEAVDASYTAEISKEEEFSFALVPGENAQIVSVTAQGATVENLEGNKYLLREITEAEVVVTVETAAVEAVEETEVPQAVQAFLDAVAALPDADQVNHENAEQVGEKVNAALDLWEALDESFLEREDVAAALEKVYAVYEAVLAAEEIEDAVTLASGYTPVTNVTINPDQKPNGQTATGKVRNSGQSLTMKVGQKASFLLGAPTNTLIGSRCGHTLAVYNPSDYCDISLIDNSGQGLVGNPVYSAGNNNGERVFKTVFEALKPGTSTDVRVCYYANFGIVFANPNLSSAYVGCWCGKNSLVYKDVTWYRYNDVFSLTVNADYQLTYVDTDGSALSMAPTKTSVADIRAELTAGTPTKEGCEFDHWEDEEGNTYQAGEKVVLEWSEGFGSAANPVTKKLTAVWKEEVPPTLTYTVTYTDGVPGETVFYDQGYEGLKAGNKTPAFDGDPDVREGYTFMGWAPAVAEKVDPAMANDKGEIIYTATWEKNQDPPEPTLTYIVIYTDGVVGETVFPDQGYEGLDAWTETPVFVDEDGNPTDPAREGYTFMGWAPAWNDEVDPTMANDKGEIWYTATWQKDQEPEPIETPSPTPSESPSPEPSETPSESPSPSEEPSESPSPSETPSESPTPSETPSESPSPSEEPSESPSPSETPSESPSPSEEPSESPSPSERPSESPTPSETPSESPTPSETPSESPTPSETPSESPSPSEEPSESPSPSETPSESPTPSETPSESPSPTPSETPSESPSPSEEPSESPSPSETPSESPSPSETPSESPAPSETPSESPAPSETPNEDPTPEGTPGPVGTPNPGPVETPNPGPAEEPNPSPVQTPVPPQPSEPTTTVPQPDQEPEPAPDPVPENTVPRVVEVVPVLPEEVTPDAPDLLVVVPEQDVARAVVYERTQDPVTDEVTYEPNVDIPAVTEVPEIVEPESPATVIVIDEEEVPQVYVKLQDPATDDYVYIPEEDVPLASIGTPQTGDNRITGLWATLFMVSLGGIIYLLPDLKRRKKKN